MAASGVNWVVSQTFSRSEQEYLEAAKLCLEKGNDVNATNSQGFTAMHGAANRGFDAMIRLLAEELGGGLQYALSAEALVMGAVLPDRAG